MKSVLAKLYLILIFGVSLFFVFFLLKRILLRFKLQKEFINLTFRLSQDQTDLELNMRMARLYILKEMPIEALEKYRYCLNNWCKDDQIGLFILLNGIGCIYLSSKDYETACDFFETALLINPNSTQTLSNLSYTYQFQGDLYSLEEVYNKLIVKAPLEKRTAELKKYLQRRLKKSE
jgi:tetratricopeptide (TPR) repeat protein